MQTFRRERANSFIQEELSVLQDALDDPRVRSVFITAVDLTRDRRVARVYVASYEGDEALKQGLQGLENSKGVLRAELAQLLPWRFSPEIEFRVDRSLQHGERIDRLLKSLSNQTAAQPPDDAKPN